MTLHEEVYSRYQEVHEGHCGYVERGKWMREFARINLLPHIAPGSRVLEVACGAGDLLDALRDEGIYAIGTDLCSENVEGARRRGHVVLQRNVLVDPLRERFDAIVAMGFIEHLPKDQLLPGLRALKSQLNPGGVVIFTTQNMDAAIGVHYRYLDITHELGFTHESLAQVGRLVFREARVYPTVYPPEPITTFKGWVVAALGPVWRRLYRYHLRLMNTPVIDSWYDKVGLNGVFYV